MHQFGIVYVATKDGRYVDEAVAAFASLKEKAPDLPATLFTTLPEMVDRKQHAWDLVVRVPTAHGFGSSLAEGKLDRWTLLPRSPYERSLLLDVDTRIGSASIADIDGILKEHDLAVVPANDAHAAPAGLGEHLFDTTLVGLRRSAAADALVEQVAETYRAQLALADDDEARFEGELAWLAAFPAATRKALLRQDRLALARVLAGAGRPAGLIVRRLDGGWLHTGDGPPDGTRVAHVGPSAGARAGEVAFGDQTSSLFPQQLFWRQHKNVAELNKQLALLCSELCTEAPAPGQTFTAGRRSPGNIFDHKSPALDALRQIIDSALRPYMDATLKQLMPVGNVSFDLSIEGWGHVMQPGEHLESHLHRGGLIFGTYVAELPNAGSKDDGRQGRLVIENPIPQAAMVPTPWPLTAHQVVDIKEGTLVLFPAYLRQSVPPVKGEGQRVVIGFTCTLKRAEA